MCIDLESRPAGLVRMVLSGPTMGSRWSAVFFGSGELDTEHVRRALQDAVDRVDLQMSSWKPESDLNRLNDAPVGAWVDIPRELVTVLDAALAIGRVSGGLFDIGVGDLVQSWGFGPGGLPAAGRGASLRIAADAPKNLQVDRVREHARKLARLRLDLSGIAKGFGVDELARVLQTFEIDSFLVGIDGEMRAGAAKPGGRPWSVGHEAPSEECRNLAGVLELRETAVATSGSYRHFARMNGRDISHTMDPRTCEPLANDLVSATVLAPTCMAADAWATAMLVAGSREALGLSEKQAVPVILVKRDGTVISTL